MAARRKQSPVVKNTFHRGRNSLYNFDRIPGRRISILHLNSAPYLDRGMKPLPKFFLTVLLLTIAPSVGWLVLKRKRVCATRKRDVVT